MEALTVNPESIRLGYDKPSYVRLAQAALKSWRRVETATNQELLKKGGALDVGPPARIDPIAAALAAEGASSERRSDADSGSLFVGLSVPSGWETLYQPDGGVILAAGAYEAFLTLARSNRASIKPGTRVRELRLHGEDVMVETDTETIRARCAVVTAAGWAGNLLDPLGMTIPIRTTREHVAYYADGDGGLSVPFIWHPPDSSPQVYGLPNLDNGKVKIGRHQAGPEVVPGSESSVDASEIDLINQFVSECTRRVAPLPVSAETCLYASTPDDDFVLDRRGSIVVGIGFGGHGFKFAPVIGELIADLVEQRPIAYGEEFSMSRFAQGEAHAE